MSSDSTETSALNARLPLPLVLAVNRACERFESAWRSACRSGAPGPTIEEELAAWSGPGRERLFAELLALELELRREAGGSPRPEAYLERFPGLEAEVRSAFAGLETVLSAGEPDDDPEATVVHQGRSPAADGPAEFAGYELLGEIGRGGMGVVYRARQLSCNRLVALKMLLSGSFASAEERERFRQEVELAANLDHPHVVPVHDVGEHDGRPFYTMKLVDGGSLADELPRLKADPRAAARVVVAVAHAMEYAHGLGFVHCDLKPSNVLLDASGQPHVTDFGLARRVAGDSALTATGAVLGTPCYMAPEQATGDRRGLTPAADVYGLGAILYELLTGRPPFRAATVPETVLQVLEREPAFPRQVNPSVPAELETICLKCLEKSPRDRYESAGALADELDTYLRGEVIAGTSPWRRLQRWSRREPELATRLVALAVVAGLTEYNHQTSLESSTGTHSLVQAELLLWAAASVIFQAMLRSGRWSEPARAAWAATDVVALTSVLAVLNTWDSELLVGYPLLIAASGLWFRAGLVWLTTALSVAGYAVLSLTHRLGGASGAWHQYPNIMIASLLVTGYVVARQVNRAQALSRYYQGRPGA
jgi:serine/threonine-protein kinase